MRISPPNPRRTARAGGYHESIALIVTDGSDCCWCSLSRLPDAWVYASPVVFVIAVVTVLSMLIFPDWAPSRLQKILLATCDVPGGRCCSLLDHDLTELPLVVTELLLLAVTAYLVRLLSVVVANLEQVLENVVTGREESRILSTVMGEETINAELFRARRFNRPVGFILLHLSGVEELKSTRAERFNYQFVLQRSYLKARVGHWRNRSFITPIRSPGTPTTW